MGGKSDEKNKTQRGVRKKKTRTKKERGLGHRGLLGEGGWKHRQTTEKPRVKPREENKDKLGRQGKKKHRSRQPEAWAKGMERGGKKKTTVYWNSETRKTEEEHSKSAGRNKVGRVALRRTGDSWARGGELELTR